MQYAEAHTQCMNPPDDGGSNGGRCLGSVNEEGFRGCFAKLTLDLEKARHVVFSEGVVIRGASSCE